MQCPNTAPRILPVRQLRRANYAKWPRFCLRRSGVASFLTKNPQPWKLIWVTSLQDIAVLYSQGRQENASANFKAHAELLVTGLIQPDCKDKPSGDQARQTCPQTQQALPCGMPTKTTSHRINFPSASLGRALWSNIQRKPKALFPHHRS